MLFLSFISLHQRFAEALAATRAALQDLSRSVALYRSSGVEVRCWIEGDEIPNGSIPEFDLPAVVQQVCLQYIALNAGVAARI